METRTARLPNFGQSLFLSDGGLETTLIFHEGVDLPHFASFVLLETKEGREQLKNYYRSYLATARQYGLGFILDTPTWRANADWGEKLGYDVDALARVNRNAVHLMQDLREEADQPDILVSGAVGPRGDGYKAGRMSREEAMAYHRPQIEAFRQAGADLTTAYTLASTGEAAGIALAAEAVGLPCALSFTLETDGRLVSGETLREAIEVVDKATDVSPAYYMVNCAHPTHLAGVFDGGRWQTRVLGLKANASSKSHAELDESTVLDDGDPVEFGRQNRALWEVLPGLRILGGCCGTDRRHIAAICEACV